MADKKDHRCYRCAYITDCGAFVCCGYLEQTGKPRSFPDGGGEQIPWSDTEKCPYYKRKKGRWFKDVPPGPGKPHKTEPEPPPEPKIDRRKGSRVSWDYKKAREMYLSGVPLKEIPKAVGCTIDALRNYIYRYDWASEAGVEKAKEREGKKK